MITNQSQVPSQNGCHLVALSTAVLAWTLPDMRPELVVADTGTTGGATGAVTTHDGARLSYTVAANDLAPEVAARFGITVDDLSYLNPLGTPAMLQVGEELNLSKAHR